MSEEIKVVCVKAFLNGGAMTDPGDVIEVSDDRAKDLERNGLITRAVKQAGAPENKMNPKVKNKGKAHDSDA